MYIAKMNNKVFLARETMEELLQDLMSMNYAIVEETDIDYQMYDGEYRTPEEIEQLEQERINNLSMTPLDFIKVLQSLGLTLEQINAFLDSNIEIKTQLLYCNHVYCGVVKQFLPIEIGGIEITADMIEQIFNRMEG